MSNYKAIVIGASLGGFDVILKIIAPLPKNFSIPIVIVQHLSPDHIIGDKYNLLNTRFKLNAKEAELFEILKAGNVYFAPAGYHLLIEKNRSFSLNVDEKVMYSRPAIDVLFETAAEAFGNSLIGIILTGANRDGTNGIIKIKEFGGLTIAQDPKTALSPEMVESAIDSGKIDHILTPTEIYNFIMQFADAKN